MKLGYSSDFHFEFYDNDTIMRFIRLWDIEEDTDVLIIAGDLHVGAKEIFKLLEYIFEIYHIPIIYIPGNHDYYNSSFMHENAIFCSNGIKQHDKYNILLNDSVIRDGIGFYGCAGNIDGSWNSINVWTHSGLNDFHHISDFSEKHEMYGKKEFEFIINNVANTDTSVVITHTMPSPKCIDPKYAVGNVYNSCFANDWSEIIYTKEPKLWICGHTHNSIDMMIHNTHIVANPYGYAHENKEWKWRYIHI